MMSLWDALRMNMMISYQELVRTFLSCFHLILNQGFTDTMQSSHCLLRFGSGLHETHRWT